MAARFKLHRKYGKTVYKILEIRGAPVMLGTITMLLTVQIISTPEVNYRSECVLP